MGTKQTDNFKNIFYSSIFIVAKNRRCCGTVEDFTVLWKTNSFMVRRHHRSKPSVEKVLIGGSVENMELCTVKVQTYNLNICFHKFFSLGEHIKERK